LLRQGLHLWIVGSVLFSLCIWSGNRPALYDSNFDEWDFPSIPQDTPKYQKSRFSTYQFPDRRGDLFGSHRSKSLLDLKPSNLKTNFKVDLNDTARSYVVEEKIGEYDYRPPSRITRKDLDYFQDLEINKKFWKINGANTAEETATQNSRFNFKPRIPIGSKLFGKIFGGDAVDFKFNGFVNLDFGYKRQNVANPAIPADRQSNGVFDFDPHANFSVTGKIGDKLSLATSYDTKASFNFENTFRVQYKAYPEEALQDVKFGNVNFSPGVALIQGSQNLFGIRTDWQFGKLKMQNVIANQRSTADEIRLQGGRQVRRFEIRMTDYEENKHFFLSQFHRRRYEPALATMPIINSGVLITRVEVYVTNRTNNTQNLRNIIAFLDLGEAQSYRNALPFVGANANPNFPAGNQANNLFANINNNTSVRNPQTAADFLELQGLRRGTDFEVLRAARKLEPNEFTFHPQLGYISLNTPLRNDEILGISFEYTFNGQQYKVGELSEDYVNRPQEEAIFVKMLRPSTIRTDLPSWDLMMKNIYALGTAQIQQQGFQLRIIYRDDISGLDNPALQEGERTKDVQLIKIFGLDQLNPRGDRVIDPQGNAVKDRFGRAIGDGNFDFVEGITINTQKGLLIFPVLEPFGRTLRSEFNAATEANLIGKYVFQELYTGTRNDAQNNFATKNKFFIKGQYEGTATGNTVFLPGINIAQGSVIVKAGGVPLTEGTDYQVNYSTGQVTITNDAVLNSGKEITVSFEKADLFNLQVRNFLGSRFEYEVDKDLKLGFTIANLRERPVLTRVAMGQEAINNTMIGFDVKLKRDSRFLTKLTDAFPLIQTKEKSTIQFDAEIAQIRPNAARLSGAVSYIDDFEGSRTPFDLGNTAHLRWKLGSTPRRILDQQGTLSSPLEYAYRRARMAWYNVDNSIFYNQSQRPSNISATDLENHYMRVVAPQEIFPNRQFENIAVNQNLFEIAYFPDERGSFNYNPNLTPDGKLPNPAQNFASITRAITQEVDFDNANIEYIEFWLLDPFIAGERGRVIVSGDQGANNTTGGELYINLGNISEDVMKDTRHFFENGLPETAESTAKDPTAWGFVPRNQFLNNAFSNSPGVRGLQDVGLDGLRNAEENDFFQNYLNSLPPAVRSQVEADVSADNFKFYLDGEYNARNAKIIERYKYYNNTEGNSPENTGGQFTQSATNFPDNEDLNTDNTISDLEEYYEYRISLRPSDLVVGQNYIVDKVEVKDPRITKNQDIVTWYQFRIPVREFTEKVGNINGFKSIRFMRLYMTGFQQPVVLRMAQFQMVANQWRRYLGDLRDKGLQLPPEPYNPSFVVSVVNVEENGTPATGVIPYVIPPGFVRDRDITTINNREFNEQSLQICVDGLQDRDARAAFKNVNLNMLYYKRLSMPIHAQSPDNNIQDGELSAIVRLGTDFNENYYEIEIPLSFTRISEVQAVPTLEALQRIIWKPENELDIALEDLVETKIQRNNTFGFRNNLFVPFTRQVGRYRVTVVGNPDLSAVLVLMLGIKNPNLPNDDRRPKSACVWFNELRAVGFDRTNGVAANARLMFNLADFAQIQASGAIRTAGFGQISQKVSERQLRNDWEFDTQGTFALDKFTPAKWGIRLPVFLSYQRRNSTPLFDPFDPDVRVKRSLEKFATDGEREFFKSLIEDRETRRSINFTNVRKMKTNKERKTMPWDIPNFGYTWSYSDIQRSSPYVASYLQQNWKQSLTYNYTREFNYIEPFKKSKAKWLQSPWLKFIKETNFNPLPNGFTARGDLDRTFIRTQLRSGDFRVENFEPFFEKFYNFNRDYSLQWNLTRNLTFSGNAQAQAIIDEPFGELNAPGSRQAVQENLLKLGRMKDYSQRFNASYKLPLDKFPITDWVTANYTYNANYRWTAASLGLEKILGNNIQNNREQSLRTTADFTKLYNKVKLLKAVNDYKPASKPNQPKLSKAERKKQKEAERKKRLEEKRQKELEKKKAKEAKKQSKDSLQKDSLQKKPQKTTKTKPAPTGKTQNPQVNPILRSVLRLLMSVRGGTFNISRNEGTILPGVIGNPRYLGLTDGWGAPGWDFVAGSQNPNQRFDFVNNGWMVIPPDTSLIQNNPFQQNRTQNISFTLNVEPFPDFRITLDAKQVRTDNYQELFRFDTLNKVYASFSPYRNGTFQSTIISWGSAFAKDNGINSETFNRFVANLDKYQQLFSAQNPNAITDSSYRRRSQDVLIAAFMETYAGQKAGSSAFPRFPLPNWQIDYNGLSKLSAFKDIFTTFTISHKYSSEYRIGNYTSALEYQNTALLQLNNNFGSYVQPFVLNANGELVPILVLGQVQVSERFSPLIGINARTKSGANIRLDINRTREIGLNLANAQITEARSNDIVIGFGFDKKNVRLPFRDAEGQRVILRNTMNFRVDFTIRDSKTFQRRIDEETVITSGNYNFQLRPNITYKVNNNLTTSFYFERLINSPATTLSFPRKNTNVGFQLRYNLTGM
jgi:cell surface protein SprA